MTTDVFHTSGIKQSLNESEKGNWKIELGEEVLFSNIEGTCISSK